METNPPDYPPPLLLTSELLHLAQQGHLKLQLASHLQARYEELFVEADRFFAQDDGTKAALYPQATAGSSSNSGYARVENEKEFLTIRHRTASLSSESTIVGLEQISAEIWHDTATLLHRVLVDLARATPALTATNSPDDLWDPILEGSLDLPPDAGTARLVPTTLRLFRYEPGSGTSDAHTDVGLLTLCVCAEPGLQVYTTADGGQGRWVDAGHATLLVGRTLRTLTGNRIRSGLHRVVATPGGRRSIVFALRPSLQSTVDMERLGGCPGVTVRDIWVEAGKGRFDVNANPEEKARAKRKEAGRRARMKERGVADQHLLLA